MPPPISSYSKGPNRSGVVLLSVGVAEGVSGKKEKEKKKSINAVMKGNHINSEIFTSGLENVMVQL